MFEESDQEEFVLYPLPKEEIQNEPLQTSHQIFVQKVLNKQPIPPPKHIDPCYQIGQKQRQQLKELLLCASTPISQIANSATQLMDILKGSSTEDQKLKIWIQIRKNIEGSDSESFTQILNLFNKETIEYLVCELQLYREKRITEEVLRIIFLFTFRKQGEHLVSYFPLDLSYFTNYLISKIPIIAKLAILCLSNIINVLPSSQVSQITLSHQFKLLLLDMQIQECYQNFFKQNQLCFLWFIYQASQKGQSSIIRKNTKTIIDLFIIQIQKIQNVNDLPLFTEGLSTVLSFIQQPNKNKSTKLMLKRSLAPKFRKVFPKILQQVQSEQTVLQIAQIITSLTNYSVRNQLQGKEFTEVLLKLIKHPNILIKVEGCKSLLNAVKIKQLGESIVCNEELVNEILTLFIYGPYDTKYYIVDIIPQLLTYNNTDFMTIFKERNIMTHYFNIFCEETHQLALLGIIQLINLGEKQAGNPEQGQGNPVIKQINELDCDLSEITSYQNHPIFSKYVNQIMDRLNLNSDVKNEQQ